MSSPRNASYWPTENQIKNNYNVLRKENANYYKLNEKLPIGSMHLSDAIVLIAMKKYSMAEELVNISMEIDRYCMESKVMFDREIVDFQLLKIKIQLFFSEWLVRKQHDTKMSEIAREYLKIADEQKKISLFNCLSGWLQRGRIPDECVRAILFLMAGLVTEANDCILKLRNNFDFNKIPRKQKSQKSGIKNLIFMVYFLAKYEISKDDEVDISNREAICSILQYLTTFQGRQSDPKVSNSLPLLYLYWKSFGNKEEPFDFVFKILN